MQRITLKDVSYYYIYPRHPINIYIVGMCLFSLVLMNSQTIKEPKLAFQIKCTQPDFS